VKLKKEPIEYVFYYTLKTKDGFQYPLWYAGFGSPWRLSENIIDALKSKPDTVNEVVTLKALEKHTKTEWFVIPVKETYGDRTNSCFVCGFTWTDAERDYVQFDRYSESMPREGLHLASVLNKHFDGYINYEATKKQILRASHCDTHGQVCGSCRKPKGRCKNCRPVLRRKN